MRCIKGNKGTETTVRKTARQAAAPVVPPTHPVAALVPILLSALSAASTGAKDASFDVRTWAAAVVDALLSRLISRIPLDGERDPFTGLNRSQIYELLKAGPNGEPVISSFTLAEPGEASGARFFVVGSALDYLHRLANQPQTKVAKGKGKKLKNHGKHS